MRSAIEFRTSKVGREFIKSFEDCKLKAYPDPKTGGEPWTCGWGSTGSDVDSKTEWTQDYADSRFEADLRYRERLVYISVHVPISQGMFDALVSIIYNAGEGSRKKDGIVRLKNGYTSTLLRKLNEMDYVGARAEFLKWVSPGTKVTRGLTRRRQHEVKDLWDAADN